MYAKRNIHSDHELYSNNGLNRGSVPEKGIKYSTSQNYSLKNIFCHKKRYNTQIMYFIIIAYYLERVTSGSLKRKGYQMTSIVISVPSDFCLCPFIDILPDT